jgi:hypothetical protein
MTADFTMEPPHQWMLEVACTPADRALLVRFWSKVDTSGDCWLWLPAPGSHAYGRFVKHKTEHVYAHRFAAERYLPDFDPALHVCHKCDVPRCVRPDHLFMGSRSDNLQDASHKGRLAGQDRDTCAHGHPFDFIDGDGRRRCRTCRRKASRDWMRRKRATS